MPDIKNLIKDIYNLVENKDGWLDKRCAGEMATRISEGIVEEPDKAKAVPRLRLSGMGARCPRQLWYSIHSPSSQERLPPWARIKYLYGHILEGIVVQMAKEAGHEVTGEQDELVVDGVVGHRDCIIDGCLVDVKSASTRAFDKFKSGSIRTSDDFGYLDQLDGYLVGSNQDPLLRVKDKGYLLAVDKTLGHLALYEHQLRESSIRQRIQAYKAIIDKEIPPACTCGTVPDGKSGNIRLDTKASYSLYKHCCFPDLRTFLYASGPVYLAKVVRKPDVTEIDRYGNFVY